MKVALATLGCKVNQYDTAALETALRRAGCDIVPFTNGADVYVVNTCTVTERADAESRQVARRAKRFNPSARVVVTGCFAQTSAPRLSAMPEVDCVIGVGRVPDLVRAVRGERDAVGCVFVDDLRAAPPVVTLGAETFTGQTRAFLKIQEGCDLLCAFCIVPFARGRSRSVEPRRVLRELQRLAARGFQEVVLTGIHLGAYGADLTPRSDLATLIEMVAERRPLRRIRLSSIDPPEVTPRLLRIIRESDVLCPHLHLPVQAGADRVLRRMRRRYDCALVRDVVTEIARVLPDAGLGTDVIAGFPAEADADFDAGYEFLAALPFTYFHVFPYSRRSGTTAAKLADAVPAPAIARRARALRRLGAEKRVATAVAWIGRTAEVLLEQARDRESGWLVGYSRNYLRVLVPGGDDLMNTEARVRLRARHGSRLAGAVLAAPGRRHAAEA